MNLTHLQRLEAESIQIMREVVAETDNPVMLYSVGKDSAAMLHVAKKAFYPSPPPFPLLHVDTTWKFQEMYALRDKAAKEAGMELLVYQNPEAIERGINPFDHGSVHTDLWKTLETVQHAKSQRRKYPGLSAIQLDRARYLAIHQPGEYRDRIAVFFRAAPNRRARWHADNGRR